MLSAGMSSSTVAPLTVAVVEAVAMM